MNDKKDVVMQAGRLELGSGMLDAMARTAVPGAGVVRDQLARPGDGLPSNEYPFREPMPCPGPSPHVLRMMQETKQVVDRLTGLSRFIGGGYNEDQPTQFTSLDHFQQRLLIEQRDQMEAYAKTLCLRYFMELRS